MSFAADTPDDVILIRIPFPVSEKVYVNVEPAIPNSSVVPLATIDTTGSSPEPSGSVVNETGVPSVTGFPLLSVTSATTLIWIKFPADKLPSVSADTMTLSGIPA